MQVLAGRYGPYVTDGTTNASLPKSADPATLTHAEAVELLKARERPVRRRTPGAASAPPARGARPQGRPQASLTQAHRTRRPDHRRGARRQRGGVAGGLARRARRAARDAAGAADRSCTRPTGCAELVCSNSFRGDKLDNAVGLLKEEMRRLGSLIMRAADAARVPGRRGARRRSRALLGRRHRPRSPVHPLITIVRGEVPASRRRDADGGRSIIATGPLTSDALSADIAALRRRRAPLFLRRDQPDRPRRVDRSIARCSAPRGGIGRSAHRRPRPTPGADAGAGGARPARAVGARVRRRRWRRAII